MERFFPGRHTSLFSVLPPPPVHSSRRLRPPPPPFLSPFSPPPLPALFRSGLLNSPSVSKKTDCCREIFSAPFSPSLFFLESLFPRFKYFSYPSVFSPLPRPFPLSRLPPPLRSFPRFGKPSGFFPCSRQVYEPCDGRQSFVASITRVLPCCLSFPLPFALSTADLVVDLVFLLSSLSFDPLFHRQDSFL